MFFKICFVASSYLARAFLILESSSPALAAAVTAPCIYLEAVVSNILVGYLKFLDDLRYVIGELCFGKGLSIAE